MSVCVWAAGGGGLGGVWLAVAATSVVLQCSLATEVLPHVYKTACPAVAPICTTFVVDVGRAGRKEPIIYPSVRDFLVPPHQNGKVGRCRGGIFPARIPDLAKTENSELHALSPSDYLILDHSILLIVPLNLGADDWNCVCEAEESIL